MDGQISISEYTKEACWYNRDGSVRKAPEWARNDRCGMCARWELLPKIEQPPDGWGVHGICSAHWSRGNQTSQSDFCNEFKDKYK